jgi:hypothetical protein
MLGGEDLSQLLRKIKGLSTDPSGQRQFVELESEEFCHSGKERVG